MAITDKSIFEQNMLKAISEAMQKELDKVAEPIMQKALADIQAEMRRRMGSMTIGLLEKSFDVQRAGDRLLISVIVSEPKGPAGWKA